MLISILGRQPELGRAELAALFPNRTFAFSKKTALIKISSEKLNIIQLGGSLKLGRVIQDMPGTNFNQIAQFILKDYQNLAATSDAKITVGLSAYDCKINLVQIQRLLQNMKKLAKNQQKSLRIIQNKDVALNTAVSHHNKLGLSDHKVEYLIAQSGGRTVIAKSLGAQNITALSKRDQERPKRDPFVGMLPPKLALQMLNLGLGERRMSEQKLSILDPFCGTGVLLQEAFLQDYAVYGTDLSEKMVDYTKKNLEWLQKTHPQARGEIITIAQADATKTKWPFAQKMDAVICETYLGQPFSATPSPDKLHKVSANCNFIIENFLKNLATQIKPETSICIAVPAWRNLKTKQITRLKLANSRNLEKVGLRLINQKPLLYFRDDQVVARDILILKIKQ